MATRKQAEKPKAEGVVEYDSHFPLRAGHYFYTQVTSTRAHDGSSDLDTPRVKALQQRLGLPESGLYDAATVDAVRAFQTEHDLGASGAVDEETYTRLMGE